MEQVVETGVWKGVEGGGMKGRDGVGQTLSDTNLLYYIYNMYNWRKYYRMTNWTDCLVRHVIMRATGRRPTPGTDTREKESGGRRSKDAAVSTLFYTTLFLSLVTITVGDDKDDDDRQ